MADLRDLHEALTELRRSGKTAKVSYYYSQGDDLKLGSGSIFVENGTDCYVSHQQLPAHEALGEIVALRFAKVATLPAVWVEHVGQSVRMDDVLKQLEPKNAVAASVAPAMGFSGTIAGNEADADAFNAIDAVSAGVSAIADSEPAKQEHVFYSHLSMQRDALEVLEALLGFGARKKVEEFAQTSPPAQHPVDFLNKCRQHAAMMLGERKAEELFKSIFEKLSATLQH